MVIKVIINYSIVVTFMFQDFVTLPFPCVQVFRGDGGDVHTHWSVYTERMDLMVQEALRLNVKWSLMELSRSFCGDGKTLLDPVFKVKVILEDRAGIEFSPCVDEMSTFISTVSSDLIKTIKGFRRLPEVLTKRVSSAREVHNF